MKKRLGQLKVAQDAILKYAKYIVKNETTLRETADHFHINFSTLWGQIKNMLPGLNPKLSEDVQKVLDKNKAMGHIRGGDSTQSKWKV